MSITVAPGAPTPTPPPESAASAPAPAATPPAPSTAAADLVEAPDAASAAGAAKAAVTAAGTKAAASLKSVPEQFPVGNLGSLEAKGLAGQAFLLDGSALRGQKLEVRRVKDGDQRGFEILFKLSPEKIAGLEEALGKNGGTKGAVEFRGLELGADGIATYTAGKGALSASSTHAPKDLDQAAAKWATKANAPKGGTIEVAGEKAALAVRGLVRIQLRGDDKTCTAQLQNMLKSFGLGHLFAPPTPKAKRTHMLMRALWQADQKGAKELSKELEKLKPEDLEKALAALGYSPERLAGLRFEEVCPGHFAVVDPQQAKDLAKAGARYLYSTVTEPAHVLSILRHGQKSSLQRYKEGMIINGMSTNADFVTGGAAGVFTRLVTQSAIYDGNSWTGRTYKLLQTEDQLARTDWYGWAGDFYGRRWELDSGVNFGAALVKSVDSSGYKTTNELIFAAGNRAENIMRVVATTEDARQKLLDVLRKEGYVPHNGLSLEEFVVMSPKFLVFGPSSFEVADPKAFASEALEKAKAGDTTQLRWFLTEGPLAQDVRAETEQSLLLGDDANLRGFVLKAAGLNGAFAMDGAGFDALATQIEARGDAGKSLKAELQRSAEPLFRSGSSKALAWIGEAKANNTLSVADDAWIRILEKLHGATGPAGELFQLAVSSCAERMMTNRAPGFLGFLATHPLITPADPKAFVDEQLTELASGKSYAISVYLAQTPAAERGPVHQRLLSSETPKAREVAFASIAQHRELGLDGPAIVSLLESLPADSSVKTQLVTSYADALLKSGDPAVLEQITKHPSSSPNLGIGTADGWKSLFKALDQKVGPTVTPFVRDLLERATAYLTTDPSLVARVRSAPNLYEVEDAAVFAENAAKEVQNGKPGMLKLGWMLGVSPNPEHRRRALIEIAKSGQTAIIDTWKDPAGKLPMSQADLRAVTIELLGRDDKSAANYLLRKVGDQIMAAADAELLSKLDPLVTAQGLGILGLAGGNFVVALSALDGKPAAEAAPVQSFLMKHGAASAFSSAGDELTTWLTNSKLKLADLNQSPAWAAETIKALVANKSHYWTNASYASYESYQAVPMAATWLLKGGGDKPDEKVLEAIEANVKSWKWQKEFLAKFVEKLEIPEEWGNRLTKAAKTGWFS
ncbi:MAG: hypothetical protein HYV07_27595 [Deltaproteobacteria bacterium]|nr:hypothetical protein [Deltaproteobacteria bacterium]